MSFTLNISTFFPLPPLCSRIGRIYCQIYMPPMYIMNLILKTFVSIIIIVVYWTAPEWLSNLNRTKRKCLPIRKTHSPVTIMAYPPLMASTQTLLLLMLMLPLLLLSLTIVVVDGGRQTLDQQSEPFKMATLHAKRDNMTRWFVNQTAASSSSPVSVISALDSIVVPIVTLAVDESTFTNHSSVNHSKPLLPSSFSTPLSSSLNGNNDQSKCDSTPCPTPQFHLLTDIITNTTITTTATITSPSSTSTLIQHKTFDNNNESLSTLTTATTTTTTTTASSNRNRTDSVQLISINHHQSIDSSTFLANQVDRLSTNYHGNVLIVRQHPPSPSANQSSMGNVAVHSISVNNWNDRRNLNEPNGNGSTIVYGNDFNIVTSIASIKCNVTTVDCNRSLSSSSSVSSYSHQNVDSLSVSALIDPIGVEMSTHSHSINSSNNNSVVEQHQQQQQHQTKLKLDSLDTNYYRYRDNDPNILLSRYPSLRRPLPPPEFADDYEGVTEIGTVSGSRVDIPCNASNWSEDEVSLVLWFRGDTGVPIYRVDARSVPLSKSTHTTADELRKRFHFDFMSKPPVLKINPVLPSDAAEYRCRVDFRQSRTQNLLVALNVTVPPKELLIMDVEGQKLDGVIGPYDENSNVLLICEAEGGKPSPKVEWYSGNHRLIDSTYTTGPHGLVRNELNIRNLNRSDFMSILTCRASNNNVTEPISATVILDMNLRPLDVKILTKSSQYSSGSSSNGSNGSSTKTSLTSSIQSATGISDSSNTVILSAGSKAEFQCRTLGSRPAAQVSWWLGSERLSSNVRDSVNEDGNATISTVTFVPDVDDNGKQLTCRADNLPMPHTALKDERLLDVHFAPQLRISFGANIGRDSIREGNDVYLECRVRANPPVKEVVWLHDGHPLHGSLTGDVNAADATRSTIIMTNQSLVIQKVHRTHRGRYQCVAFNEQGETVSEPLQLKVNFAPVCTMGQKHQYGVSRNEQIRIRCQVDAEPTNGLTFRWTLNTSGSESSTEWASFTVNESTSIATYRPESSLDYGTLACMAQNSIGSQMEPCVFNVVPAGRPDPVRSCAITNHSMSTLLVECIPGDDGGLRQHFNLEVYIATNQRLHSNHSSSQPNFIVSSLAPGTQYSLVLYANNAKGRSHSVSLSAVTLSPPEKHIARGSIEQIVVHPVLAILVGTVATIVLTIIGLMLIIRGRHSRYNYDDGHHHNNRPNGSNVSDSVTLTANDDLKMKMMNISIDGKLANNGKNGTNNKKNKKKSDEASLSNGFASGPKSIATNGSNSADQKCHSSMDHENCELNHHFNHNGNDDETRIDSNEAHQLLLSHNPMTYGNDGQCDTTTMTMAAAKTATSLMVDSTGATGRIDSSQHSNSSSSTTTIPMSDLMAPNGTIYVTNDGNLIQCSSPSKGKLATQSPTRQLSLNRHLIADMSSMGSTCCSSSNSSSPHTLMPSSVNCNGTYQIPPPVPSLPHGVMLFATHCDMIDTIEHSQHQTQQTMATSSPSHYNEPPPPSSSSSTSISNPYHPYLNPHTPNATLPRHYSIGDGSTYKMYGGEKSHPTAQTVIVNGPIDGTNSYQNHVGLYQHHPSTSPIVYYNNSLTNGAIMDVTSIDGNVNYHHHPHSHHSNLVKSTNSTLPSRRCSVGPLESQPPLQSSSLSLTSSTNETMFKKSTGTSNKTTNVNNMGPTTIDHGETMPLMVSNDTSFNESATNNRPHEICLNSSPRKGATAV